MSDIALPPPPSLPPRPIAPDLDEPLAELLALTDLGGDRWRAQRHQQNAGGEVFGGQYLGLAVAAAVASGEGRAAHALTGWFVKAADASGPWLEMSVRRVRDGRSFAHRRVVIEQAGQEVFYADVSLHDAEAGQPSHQVAAPQLPRPEALHNLQQLLQRHGVERLGPRAPRVMGVRRCVEVLPLNAEAGFGVQGDVPASDVWLRVTQLGTLSPQDHYAALAYLSDYWVNSSSRILHAPSMFSGEMLSSSLNHGIWFHRVPDVSRPVLYSLDSPSTHGGTGFNRGLMFDDSGALLASTVQEALVRRMPTDRSR